MLKVKKIISGALEVNCYLIYDSQTLKTVVVDPGEEGEKVILEIKKNNLKPEMLINTHGHFDHIFSDDKIRLEFNIPLAVHKDEARMIADVCQNYSQDYAPVPMSVKNPEILLEDEQEVKLSFTTFKVIHTPGHTDGGICLLFDGFLISGDTLFAGTIGRTDFVGGDIEKMKGSLLKLKKLSPNLIIYPGHSSQTTLANELRHNSYLK
jgi:glyoxylase-like metal-dependent hydrolase (beta-lactamase superfamily II)